MATAHAAAPERREAQRRLAHEVTALVHGDTAAPRPPPPPRACSSAVDPADAGESQAFRDAGRRAAGGVAARRCS